MIDVEAMRSRLKELQLAYDDAKKRHRKRGHILADMQKIQNILLEREIKMTPQEEANEELRKFQTSDEGRAEQYLYETLQIIDDLVKAAGTRGGYKSLRADYPRLLECRAKINNLTAQLAPMYGLGP